MPTRLRLAAGILLAHVLSGLPASAGPVEFSLMDLCLALGPNVFQDESPVIAYPTCAGGAGLGLVTGAVAFPVAGVAGVLGSPWGHGEKIFYDVWGTGFRVGLWTGTIVTGYPPFLLEEAFWDGPRTIVCSLTESCSGLKPDPGVDYEAKARDVLRNLPYDVYLPAGLFDDVSPITIREYFSGTHDAIVQGTIRRVASRGSEEGAEPTFVSTEIFEMEDLGELPEHCPGYSFEIEYHYREGFSTTCELVAHSKNGTPIYRSTPEPHIFPKVERYSMAVKTTLKRTLIVLRFPSDMDDSEIPGFLPVFDHLQPIYGDKVVEMYDRSRAETGR